MKFECKKYAEVFEIYKMTRVFTRTTRHDVTYEVMREQNGVAVEINVFKFKLSFELTRCCNNHDKTTSVS